LTEEINRNRFKILEMSTKIQKLNPLKKIQQKHKNTDQPPTIIHNSKFHRKPYNSQNEKKIAKIQQNTRLMRIKLQSELNKHKKKTKTNKKVIIISVFLLLV
jgi:fructose-1,6-bisphosphatase